jgi:hypothetical protein
MTDERIDTHMYRVQRVQKASLYVDLLVSTKWLKLHQRAAAKVKVSLIHSFIVRKPYPNPIPCRNRECKSTPRRGPGMRKLHANA